MKKDTRKILDKRAASLALFLSILWSGNPVGTKLGLLDTTPLRLGWMRFLAGGVVVLVYSLIKKIFEITLILFFNIVNSSITLSSDLNLNFPIAPDFEPSISSDI